uniref:Uncharacterized protein n=1 Tax=Anguilla anguilla TaxID=7936 RepID=A0A0E9UBT5_ANGAN
MLYFVSICFMQCHLFNLVISSISISTRVTGIVLSW